ncbi:MAG: uncharacterized protein K0R64_3320 [Novosphingobium lindaniclasticum]|jgi:hypothetical protein|uniref:hypothetical protein n=1 Tax=Novosphingobium TaxID=165696 RepID=UPI00240A5ACC|nr:hypothetical protein [Novosphingobium lindaniclasticum]MDF2640336.1 uncharacterized protein [Novosphingobium lindaniclasticum]MEE4454424.1 hypothetical protein [Novosphingobium resinovorum]
MGNLKTAGTGLLALLVAGAAPTALHAQEALGANYNEHFEDVDYHELEEAHARWVRIFLPMPQVDAGAAQHGAVRTILEVGTRGYHTMLTLKFPYNHKDFPKPGSPAMDRELARVDAVLPLVMGKIDILVIGNEPFIESRKEDWDEDFSLFYETIARRVIAYRQQRCGADCKTRLYMGALNQMWKPAWRTPTTERWMAFVKATPEIDGVNIHPHVNDITDSKAFLDYILPRMRPDQKFTVTEFSLVWWWEKQMQQPVSPAYAQRYKLLAGTQNWQVIAAALKEPFPKAQWDDFLRLSPWFEEHKHYIRDQMKMFRDTGKLAVATYGFKQGSSMSAQWGPKKTPWLINSVFAGRTIKPDADGSSAPNYAWIDDFIAEQKD